MWRNYRLAERKNVSLGQNSRDADKCRHLRPSWGRTKLKDHNTLAMDTAIKLDFVKS
jgi:hypothetical protein